MKLRDYSTMAATIAAIGASHLVEAQITYFDVVPDAIANASSYFIDLDGNGTNELEVSNRYLTSSYGGGSTASVKLASGVSAVGYMTSVGRGIADPLAAGIELNAALNWISGSVILERYSVGPWGGVTDVGMWGGLGDRYLGVRYSSTTGDTYYGWVRMSVASTSLFITTVKDMAGEESAFEPLKTGESCEAPGNLTSLVSSSSSATISWDPVPDVDKYQIQGRVLGATSWISRSSTTASKSVGDLNPATTYEWQVRARCLSGQITDWSPLSSFSTIALKTVPIHRVELGSFKLED